MPKENEPTIEEMQKLMRAKQQGKEAFAAVLKEIWKSKEGK